LNGIDFDHGLRVKNMVAQHSKYRIAFARQIGVCYIRSSSHFNQGRPVMIRRFMLATAIVVFSSAPSAQELYGTNNVSIRESATPGEMYFDDGVRAVKARDYWHAIAMYKVAASWAYKPAEYNLGVIFAKGEGGVQADLPQAYAWLVLAAERGDSHYVEARDRVKSALDDAGVKQSEVLLSAMRPSYADEVALVRAKTKWREVLSGATGSHVGYTGDNMQVGQEASFQGNPTSAVKTKSNAGHGRGSVPGASGINAAADVIGGSGVSASTAYRDLHATDNPYDPRFSAAVVTVGELKGVDAKKTDPRSEDEAPADKH
jgi:hypothetical protein